MAEALLTVEGLEAGYGEVQILWGVSLAAGRGHLTAIVGANGAGKTTLLSTIASLLRPTGGRVTFRGEAIAYIQPRPENQQQIGFVQGRVRCPRAMHAHHSQIVRSFRRHRAQSVHGGEGRNVQFIQQPPQLRNRS